MGIGLLGHILRILSCVDVTVVPSCICNLYFAALTKSRLGVSLEIPFR